MKAVVGKRQTEQAVDLTSISSYDRFMSTVVNVANKSIETQRVRSVQFGSAKCAKGYV